MGRERECEGTWDGATSSGRLLLEADFVLFRGDRRLKIPIRDLKRVTASDGRLRLTWTGGNARFELGKDAAAWAARLLNPRSRLEKLGIKASTRVRLAGVFDPSFTQELAAAGVRAGAASPDLHLMCLQAAADLRRIGAVAKRLEGAQALWVVYPRGRPEISEGMVLQAGREAGLKDVKVMRFSQTQTALKFVLPADRR